MKVNAVRMQTSDSNYKKMTPAKTGAFLTAGVLGASTAISWVTKPDEMCKVVQECGGKKGYVAKYLLGLSLLSAAGALLNSALHTVTKLVQPKNDPKAVN